MTVSTSTKLKVVIRVAIRLLSKPFILAAMAVVAVVFVLLELFFFHGLFLSRSIEIAEGQEMGIFETVVAGLILAGATGTIGYIFARSKYKKVVDSAPTTYAGQIGRLIEQASKDDGPVRVNAQAIVSTRNDLSSTLMSLKGIMNSDIDVIAELLGGQDNDDLIAERMAVLVKKWPAKTEQVEIEIRKLLTELGFDRL